LPRPDRSLQFQIEVERERRAIEKQGSLSRHRTDFPD
jgi:hypothetical protein